MRSFSRSFGVTKIRGYLDELFPGFDEGNPFVDPHLYKFPFSFIPVSYLMSVYQLEDRISLLEKADEMRMPYNEFLDFVKEHVLIANQKLGRDRYTIMMVWARCPPYIRDNDRIIV